MRKYSPNLKPHAQRNHADAAERLGVPRSNILDLRGQVNAIDTVVPVAIESDPQVTLVESTPTPEVLEPQIVPEQARLAVRTKWNIGLALKPALGFAVLAGLALLPATTIALWHQAGQVTDDIRGYTGAAAEDLQRAATATSDAQFDTAATSFGEAESSFVEARQQLHQVNTALEPVLSNLPATKNPYITADSLLIVGEQMSAAGQDLAYAFQLMEQVAHTTGAEQPADLFVAAHSVLRPIIPRLERAELALADVDVSTVPTEYRATVETTKTAIPLITASLKELLSLSESLVTLLGHGESKRYLVIFQNNREIRATGGFMGSFAVIDIEDGRVSSVEIPGGGPYDLQGSLTEHVIAPQPLHLVNSSWELQDANWWPDFPTSAQKIQWFYEHSGGTTVDGVMTLTPEIIEQMLAVTGSIEMPEYDTVVDSENFYQVTQTQAERKYDDTRESKKFIADLTPKLLDQLFSVDAGSFLPVMQVVYDGLQQKDILLYFNDEFIQQEFSTLGWTGEIKQTDGDYLQVVDTNIGGGKTDAAIQTTIEHQADIAVDGSVIDTVTITRLHTGSSDDVFANTTNVDYLRLYVPQGSTLLSAEGFTQPDPGLVLPVSELDEPDQDLAAITGPVAIDSKTNTRMNDELGKTVFGNWIQTAPGTSSTVTVRYRLPFTVTRSNWVPGKYSLFIQKQPGSFDPIVLSAVHYPTSWKQAWSYPDATLTIHDTLQYDRFMGVVFE